MFWVQQTYHQIRKCNPNQSPWRLLPIHNLKKVQILYICIEFVLQNVSSSDEENNINSHLINRCWRPLSLTMDYDYLQSPTRLEHHHTACTKCIHKSQEKSFYKGLAHYNFQRESKHHLYLRRLSCYHKLLRRIYSMLKCIYNKLSQKVSNSKIIFELTACVATSNIIFS